jgi:UDP-4-amino-4,6-dideoxy-N-acetyl-beta-L-altrosamine transaminase
VSSHYIPYGRQWVDDEDIRAVTDVLRSDYLTTGPAVEEFESKLAAITGARFAVAVNSGTSALHAMYFAAGLGPGDEIITSPLTFAATANAALYLGASVRFADVLPETGNIDPNAVEALITPRTKLIVPVDFAGHPADYDALADISSRHAIRLVADAAHSLGASYRDRPVGTLAVASELSFHPVKPITTAEGGAVVTNDEAMAVRAARFRTHGITKESSELSRDEGPWYYEQLDLGYNYRLTDIQAALGVSQLRNLERFISRRRQIASIYARAFADLDQLTLPSAADNVAHGWHLYVVRVNRTAQRRSFFERLRGLGLGVQVHYVPVYWHPYYRELGWTKGICPKAEDFYSRAISLPLFPMMSDAEVERVVDAVRQAAVEIL